VSREPFFFPCRVRYSEIDGEGVVFNARPCHRLKTRPDRHAVPCCWRADEVRMQREEQT
jgi:hypothetical protein